MSAQTQTQTRTTTPAAWRRRGSTILGRLRSAPARIPLPLRLILAVAVAQCIAWDVALPAFQGPDEAGHFAYIQHLGETGKLPSVTAGRTPNSSEEQAALNWLNLQALTGSLGGRPAWSTADLRLWHHVEETLPPGS